MTKVIRGDTVNTEELPATQGIPAYGFMWL